MEVAKTANRKPRVLSDDQSCAMLHITSGGPLDDFPSPDLGGEHCDPSVSPGPGSKRVLPIHLPQLPGELSTETEKEFGGFKYMVVSHSSVRAFEYLRER